MRYFSSIKIHKPLLRLKDNSLVFTMFHQIRTHKKQINTLILNKIYFTFKNANTMI